MILGSGPGRGVPWWRWRRVLTLGLVQGLLGPEPAPRANQGREGRTVAVIGARQ